MAIPTNRVLVDTITSLTQLSFDNKSDTTKTKTASASIAGSTNPAAKTNTPGTLGNNGVKSVFSQPDKPTISQANAAIGNIDPASNIPSTLPKVYKKSADSLNIDRYLSNPTHLSFTGNMSGTDLILTGSKPIIPISKTIYPSDESKIDELVDTVGKTQLGNEFKKYMNQDMFKSRIKVGLSKTNLPIGNTVKGKLNLTKFISPCKGIHFSSGFDLSGIFNLNFLASLFDGLLCQGIGSVVAFIENVMKIDPNNAPSMLTALTHTLNKDSDHHVISKLITIHGIKDKLPSGSGEITTRGVTHKVLENIDKDKTYKNQTSKHYLATTSALDGFDPNWDKDFQGNLNVSSVSGNKTMSTMASNYLQNKSTQSTYDGTAVNNIGRDESIVIVNSFA